MGGSVGSGLGGDVVEGDRGLAAAGSKLQLSVILVSTTLSMAA